MESNMYSTGTPDRLTMLAQDLDRLGGAAPADHPGSCGG
jgi:hypothetical protein